MQKTKKPNAVWVSNVACLSSAHYSRAAVHADSTGRGELKNEICRKGVHTYCKVIELQPYPNSCSGPDSRARYAERSVMFRELAELYGILEFNGLKNRYAVLSKSMAEYAERAAHAVGIFTAAKRE